MDEKRKGLNDRAIRVGIVGAGGIAEVHAGILKVLPEVELVAVADFDYSKAVAFQKRYGLKAAFDSVRSMAACELDAVHVLTPPHTHAAATIECLEQGWHAFVEKPFAVSPAECENMKRAAALYGRKVGVNHNLTFTPSYLTMLDAIRNCRLGEIQHAVVVYNFPLRRLETGMPGHWMFRNPGNLLLEVGPHPASTLQLLMGRVQQAATAVSTAVTLGSGATIYRRWQSSLVCERGTAQFFFSGDADYKDGWITVIGQDGAATVDLLRDTVTITEKSRFSPAVDNLRVAAVNSRSLLANSIRGYREYFKRFLGSKTSGDPYYLGMIGSIRAFHQALKAGTPPPIGLDDGAMVVEYCDAMIRSGHEFLAQSKDHEGYVAIE